MLDLSISRRTLLAAAAASGFALSPIAKAVAAAMDDCGTYSWCACVINCGQRCPVRCYTKNGQVIRIETDNTQPDTLGPRQIRACQRGRSMRERIYSPDRLKYPMKRVGKRGEGKFGSSWNPRKTAKNLTGRPKTALDQGREKKPNAGLFVR